MTVRPVKPFFKVPEKIRILKVRLKPSPGRQFQIVNLDVIGLNVFVACTFHYTSISPM